MALQIEGGGMQGLPTLMKDWISWGEATPDMYTGGSDTDPARIYQYARDAGYGFNTPGIENDPFFSSPFYRNTNNYEWSFDPQTGPPTVRVKTADKTGTAVKYVQDAAGNWVPDYNQQTNAHWDTNQNDELYKGIGMVVGAAIGGNLAAASGMLGAGAQGAWQGGMAGGAATGASGAGGAWGIVDPSFTAFNAVPGAAGGAINPYALTAAELGAPGDVPWPRRYRRRDEWIYGRSCTPDNRNPANVHLVRGGQSVCHVSVNATTMAGSPDSQVSSMT